MATILTVKEIMEMNEDQNSRAYNFMVNGHYKEAFEIFDVMAEIEDRERPEFFNEIPDASREMSGKAFRKVL